MLYIYHEQLHSQHNNFRHRHPHRHRHGRRSGVRNAELLPILPQRPRRRPIRHHHYTPFPRPHHRRPISRRHHRSLHQPLRPSLPPSHQHPLPQTPHPPLPPRQRLLHRIRLLPDLPPPPQLPLLAISLNYRLAPEHRLPAAYDDAWAAIHWLFSLADPWLARFGDPNRVFLAGDSAGGNIVHQAVMRAGAAGLRVKGMALIHPFFWGSVPVWLEPGDDEFRVRMNRRWWFVFPGADGLDDPRWNPTAEGAPSLKGLGCERVLVTVAERDYLKYRGREYYEKLKGSGWEGVAEYLESPAVGHVFHSKLKSTLQ